MPEEQGKLDEAVACYRRALQLQPDHAEAHNNLGNALQDQGKLDEAVACYRRALQLKPDFAEAHNNLGVALQEQGKLDEAVACYRRALELEPDYAEAHYNLGNVLLDQGKLDEAVACYRRALELKPDLAEAHNNLGNASSRARETGRSGGLLSPGAGTEARPMPTAYNNLGNALYEQGKLDEAEASFRRALELQPDLALAHEGLATLHLVRGDFSRVGRSRVAVADQADPAALFRQPRWDGCPLAGKTILLHAEAGLGDTIHFVRYAPLVKRLGGTVVVESQKPLLRLLKTCPGIDRLVGQGDEIPEFAAQAPLVSLPGIFQTSLDTIPAAVPYLFADPVLIESWRERFREAPGYKIGINWHGRPGPTFRVRRIPLREFAAVAQVPGVRLISLQKGAAARK